MLANARNKLIRRYRKLEQDGAMLWRRGTLAIELEPCSDLITVRREARRDCRQCEGTGSLYVQADTGYDEQPYYDYAGTCPHCPEPRLYASVHSRRVAVATRRVLAARPTRRQKPAPARPAWEDEPPF